MTTTRLPRAARPRRLLATLITTAALAVCVTACSAADNAANDAADSGGEVSGDVSGPASTEEAPQGADELTDGSRASSGSADSEAAPDAPAAARPPASERAVISTGTVSLFSDDVAQARRDVQRIVDAHQGRITEEDTQTDDDGVAQYSRLVVRVPANAFATTLLALEKAAELRSSKLTTDDVTGQVIDTDARVRAQQGSLRRVEQLLAEADTLKDIIWIESQLTQRQAELDSLKSQQAHLADQTSESTITIDIERPYSPPEEEDPVDEDAGFLVGLKGGLAALAGAATVIATIVGALLPFAVVGAALGIPVWLLVRRTRRRRVQAPASA